MALYRAIETSSCLDDLTQLDCHSEPICWRHDLDRYRYSTHGLTAAFQALGVLVFAVALCVPPVSDEVDVDSSRVSSRRARSAVQRPAAAAAAEPHTPVPRSDVRPRPRLVTDVTADVTNITAGCTPERYGSIYDSYL